MKKQTGRAVAEICGGVIGAGFASGREIAAFFSRFGMWSWPGVILAGVVMGWICRGVLRSPGVAGMPRSWLGTWRQWLWQGMFTALLGATGASMLAGGGEIAALVLPLRGARLLGLGLTLALGWQLAGRESRSLAGVCRGLLICLVGVVLAGLFLPARQAVAVAGWGGGEGMLMGLCYGGFNVALATPVMAQWGQRMPHREKPRCAWTAAVVITLLLACGNGALLRNTALLDEQLPFVMLLSPLGRWGYLLAAAALYLAALTTMAACLRGLRAMAGRWTWLCAAVMAVLSLGGLEAIVGLVYPALGAGCFLLLLWARWSNGTKT